MKLIPTALSAACLAVLTPGVQAKLVAYPAPEGAPKNEQYEVWVREKGGPSQPLFVYNAVVDPNRKSNCGFVLFDADFSRPVEIAIRRSETYQTVEARPESRGVTPTRRGDYTILTLEKPTKLSIEFDGDIQSPLYIFANPLEKDPIRGPSSKVVYYGPGIHLLGSDGTGTVPIEAGTTVYLAGGAIVYGRIAFGGKDNVTVRGRGILCGTRFNHDPRQKREQMIYAGNARNFTLDGITILDAPVWNVHLHNLTDSSVRNVKILAWQLETDGINPRGCRNLVIEDCFIRSGDDSISIKLGNAGDPKSVTQSNRNIRVENCIFWPDKAHALLVGPEGAWAGLPEDHLTEEVLFRDIDILRVNEHNPDFYGAMAIMCADGQTIRNITFDNIRIASVESGNALDIRYVDNVYTDGFGESISQITFRNIDLPSSPAKNRIMGLDAAHPVDGVTFIHVRYQGEDLQLPHAAFEVNRYVTNLVVTVD